MNFEINSLQNEILNNLNSIRDKSTIKAIKDIIVPLRKEMDKYDPLLVNLKDGFVRHVSHLFSSGISKDKNLIENDLYDIIEGFSDYSDEDKNKVFSSLKELSLIHDRTIWEKIASVLRAS